jgi:hypothetical protein
MIISTLIAGILLFEVGTFLLISLITAVQCGEVIEVLLTFLYFNMAVIMATIAVYGLILMFQSTGLGFMW